MSVEYSIYQSAKGDKAYLQHSHNGLLSFINHGKGWAIRNGTGRSIDMGRAVTAAMGLTECCLRRGRGKVMFIAKGQETVRSLDRESLWTEAICQVPSLLYVDYKWDERSKKEWLDTPQIGRLRLLNARANALSSDVPVMPLNTYFEIENYDNIVFTENLAVAGLYMNDCGYAYLGWMSDMTARMGWSVARTKGRTITVRGKWMGKKADLTQYRQRSGTNLAKRLAEMYREQRPDSIWTLGQLINKVVAAHDAWVNNGGYTIELEFGTVFAEKIKRKLEELQIARLPPPTTRIGVLLREIAGWNAVEQAAVQDFIDEANGGLMRAMRFSFVDPDFLALAQEKKLVALEYLDLYLQDEKADNEDDADHEDDGEDEDEDVVLRGRRVSAAANDQSDSEGDDEDDFDLDS